MTAQHLYLHTRETNTGRTSRCPAACSGSDSHIEIEFIGLHRERLARFFIAYGVPGDIHALERVYLVVPRYQIDNSFSLQTGLWTVWAIVGSEDSAKAIASDLLSRTSTVGLPWVSQPDLDRIEIHCMPIGTPKNRKVTVTHHE